MKEVNPQKLALLVGLFTGGWHVVWSLFVAVGLAQPLLDFIFSLHMLQNPMRVTEFNLITAVLLILITFLVGYVGGWILGALWNKLHEK